MFARRARVVPIVMTISIGACGYQSARNAEKSADGWCVASGAEPATHPDAVSALELGVRDELARNAALGSCEGGRHLVIRVLDVRFEPVGVLAGDEEPFARSSRVIVHATAKVRDGRDLGEVEESYVVATGQTAAEEENARSVGVVMAARRAGEALAGRLR